MRMFAAVLAATAVVACAPTDEQPADLVPLLPVTAPNTVTITQVPTTVAPTTTIAPPAVDYQALADLQSAARKKHGLCGEWHDIAISVGFSEPEWDVLKQIIARETGDTCRPDLLNDNSKSRDMSWGLTQINTRDDLWADRQQLCGLTAPSDLLDPTINLACAHALMRRSGWAPWRWPYQP